MSLFDQIGELLLGAVPTIVLVTLFYFFLKAFLFKPLEKILEQRAARIEGARKEAEAYQVEAADKEKAYAEALKKARSEMFAEQEAARRAALDERSRIVKQARDAATERIRTAKARIEQEAAAARTALDRETESLAGEIVKLVLERRPPASRGVQ